MKDTLRNLIPNTEKLTGEALDQLEQHWQLLIAWNKRTNLTTITDPERAAAYHYFDSLALLDEPLRGPVVDMGSGGGFPGIPLAICRPELSFVLVEPRRKRVSFLRSAISRIGLENVEIRMTRSNDAPSDRFGSLVTRATFSSPEGLTLLKAWVQPGGSLYFYRAAEAEPISGSVRITYSVGLNTHAIDRLEA